MHSKQDMVRTRFARRDFLGAGAAGVGVAAAGPLLAQQLPSTGVERVKGPLVWLDMDQAELDAAYDQIKYAPNLPQITRRYATNSEAVRSRLGRPRRFAYGPTAIVGSTSTRPYNPTRRSTSSSTAARGVWASPRTTLSRPSYLCIPVRISWCPISSWSRMRMAA